MPYDEDFDRAVTEAEERGTLDYSDEDERQAFNDALNDLLHDEDGNERGFPSAGDVDPEEWQEFMDFMDEYDLWDEFRDEWEDYEKAA